MPDTNEIKEGGMKEKVRGVVIAGLIMSCVFASFLIGNLFSAYKGKTDIWWTPKTMMLSLERAKERVEVYVGGTLLSEQARKGMVTVSDESGGQYTVYEKNIGVRVNNWDGQKAALLERALLNAFGAGAGLSLLLVGLFLRKI
ncbi:MAG: hypothetical protein JW938_04900 [Candidatus Omnitrophica bacterium]|nr:hypothetical protein [Candidatus Omnitrophota bacterium]